MTNNKKSRKNAVKKLDVQTAESYRPLEEDKAAYEAMKAKNTEVKEASPDHYDVPESDNVHEDQQEVLDIFAAGLVNPTKEDLLDIFTKLHTDSDTGVVNVSNTWSRELEKPIGDLEVVVDTNATVEQVISQLRNLENEIDHSLNSSTSADFALSLESRLLKIENNKASRSYDLQDILGLISIKVYVREAQHGMNIPQDQFKKLNALEIKLDKKIRSEIFSDDFTKFIEVDEAVKQS